MTMLFDRNYEQEILKRNSREEGRLEGQQMEKENGIRSFVHGLKKFVSEKQQAIQALSEQYQLPLSVAQEKVDLYW